MRSGVILIAIKSQASSNPFNQSCGSMSQDSSGKHLSILISQKRFKNLKQCEKNMINNLIIIKPRVVLFITCFSHILSAFAEGKYGKWSEPNISKRSWQTNWCENPSRDEVSHLWVILYNVWSTNEVSHLWLYDIICLINQHDY